MKVYITRGHHRGRVGTINGELSDRHASNSRLEISKTFVKFPNTGGAPEVHIIPIASMRELTKMEILFLPD